MDDIHAGGVKPRLRVSVRSWDTSTACKSFMQSEQLYAVEVLLKLGLYRGLAVLTHRVERLTSTWNCRAHLSQQMLWQFCPALRAEASFMAVCCNVKCNCTGNFLRGGVLCRHLVGEILVLSVMSTPSNAVC